MGTLSLMIVLASLHVPFPLATQAAASGASPGRFIRLKSGDLVRAAGIDRLERAWSIRHPAFGRIEVDAADVQLTLEERPVSARLAGQRIVVIMRSNDVLSGMAKEDGATTITLEHPDLGTLNVRRAEIAAITISTGTDADGDRPASASPVAAPAPSTVPAPPPGGVDPRISTQLEEFRKSVIGLQKAFQQHYVARVKTEELTRRHLDDDCAKQAVADLKAMMPGLRKSHSQAMGAVSKAWTALKRQADTSGLTESQRPWSDEQARSLAKAIGKMKSLLDRLGEKQGYLEGGRVRDPEFAQAAAEFISLIPSGPGGALDSAATMVPRSVALPCGRGYAQ